MKLTIQITNTECKILEHMTQDQLIVLQEMCSFEVEGAEYKAEAFRNRRGGFNWDGRRKLFNIQTRTFPIGLLTMVTNSLLKIGVHVEFANKRKNVDSDQQFTAANYERRSYQDAAILQSLIYGNGIIKAATGSGKTTIAARTIAELNKTAIFVVHTRDLLYQTMEAFQRIFDNPFIGQIGDGVINYAPITVATMQSLAILGGIKFQAYKYDEDDDRYRESIEANEEKRRLFNEYRMTVGTVMFDEVQRICSQTAYASRFLFPNANNAYGYSASPWRDDGSDLMIEAAFGSRIIDITASELIDQGYLVRPIIDIHRVNNNTWSGKTYEQVYKSAITDNMLRNIQVMSDAKAHFELGRNTLVLVTQIKHGEVLEKMMLSMGIPAQFISGKSGMKKRKRVIEDMRNGNAPIVIASTIADVGLDVPRLQAIVEAGAGKSSVTALQRLGRIMRPFPGKEVCYFTTYRDNAIYLNSQIDRKIEIWKTEPAFIINEH